MKCVDKFAPRSASILKRELEFQKKQGQDFWVWLNYPGMDSVVLNEEGVKLLIAYFEGKEIDVHA